MGRVCRWHLPGDQAGNPELLAFNSGPMFGVISFYLLEGWGPDLIVEWGHATRSEL